MVSAMLPKRARPDSRVGLHVSSGLSHSSTVHLLPAGYQEAYLPERIGSQPNISCETSLVVWLHHPTAAHERKRSLANSPQAGCPASLASTALTVASKNQKLKRHTKKVFRRTDTKIQRSTRVCNPMDEIDAQDKQPETLDEVGLRSPGWTT